MLVCASVGVVGPPACNDCDFWMRCADNAVERCGGVDQFIGRSIERTPCVALNPVCISHGGKAYCAASDKQTCTPGETRCEGNVLFQCEEPGFEVAADCGEVKIHRLGGGLDPAGYTCNTNAGLKAGCRTP